MKLTIVEKQVFEKGVLKASKERVFYPQNIDELSMASVGYRAEKIKLEIEFEQQDIPKLIEFLANSTPCFTK